MAILAYIRQLMSSPVVSSLPSVVIFSHILGISYGTKVWAWLDYIVLLVSIGLT